MNKKTFMHHPAKLLVLSFLVMIVIGTLLLALPIARLQPISWFDLFFTATSTTTVCGLYTIPIDQFTTFGHVVLFFLMQIGGLGLITMTLFFISLFAKLGFSSQMMAGKLLEVERMPDVNKILVLTCVLSLMIEFIGACFIFLTLKDQYDILPAIGLSIFHSVSAFCNAGISLFPHGMISFSNDPFFLLVTAILILFGSLGFVPWFEIMKYTGLIKEYGKRNLSLHSRIVLVISVVLILFGTGLFWVLESNNTLAQQSYFVSFVNAFFNASSIRSAGFLSVPFADLHMATIFIIMVFSFIGSSSGSTGSGIKTTTFAMLLFTAKSLISGRQNVEVMGRTIPRTLVYRATATIFIAFSLVLGTSFFLLISEPNWSFLDIILESVAAFANLGISSGITSFLSTFGKILIMITMLAGRLGTLTLALAVVGTDEKKKDYTYPEGKVLLS
ncbi:MAG TPA: potassium transporter TrkG [Candidatus Babeliales bacterium]|nr:potassium transporter TrkG [Candidatus Babeliales bacterium]